MTRRRNGKPIHGNRLLPSKWDDVALAAAVEDKFISLSSMYARTKHVPLVPPSHLDQDFLRWRQMRVRHRGGDCRHTDAEMRSVKAVAEWTLKMKAELCNQPEPKKVEWRD